MDFAFIQSLLPTKEQGFQGALLIATVKYIRDISKDVSALNIKMAVVVNNVEAHEKRLDRVESQKQSGSNGNP